jgi:succinate-semialdehyde dehydrogenase/glutarate-semialdehyde dehydrogenase
MALATEELIGRGEPLPFWIGGEWVVGGGRMEVVEPATGSMLAYLGYGGREEALAAVDAASEAFLAWSSCSARQRADVLLRTSSILAERAGPIGRMLAAETGKRLPEAVGEVRFAAEYFRWFAEEIRRPRGYVLASEDPGRRQLTLSLPAGVAACLTPWNFPVSIQARKLAPALAAGDTVVARPSEKAPIAVSEIFRALEEAGLPPGAANLVSGPAGEQAEALLSHPRLRVVSFTGSTEVGAHLMSLASRRIVRVALELGGNAPFMVFADADLDSAVEGLMVAKFRNNGQSCIGANRVLVERSVMEEFCARLAEVTSSMTVGNPLDDPCPDVGPLIDRSRVEAVEALVADALEKGARWIGGSPRVPSGACYTRPGFLADVEPSCSLATTEVFGPVAGIFPFDTEEEAIASANATELGLAAYVYTSDPSRQWRLAELIETGILGINHPLPSVAFAPMGGVKQSGLGREGAHEGLEEFTVTKYVSLGI